ERKYVEEVGTSNAFFRVEDKVYTAPLQGSILGGITRDTSIKLLQSWGVEVVEELFTIDQLIEWHRSGKLKEALATGTAAVIAPIGTLGFKGKDIHINNKEIGPISQRLYDEITGIQKGEKEDKFNWTLTIE